VKARRVAVLGSTGSIGVNALAVLRRLGVGPKGPFRVASLSAQENVTALAEQAAEFSPSAVALATPAAAREMRAWARRHRPKLRVWEGTDGLARLASAPDADLVLSAVVGSTGLIPLLAAVRAGKKVALANKEALIVAGDLITSEARRHGAELIPVDSEHSAIFQCLGGLRPFSATRHNKAGALSGKATKSPPRGVKRLILTASGGAFYRRKGSLDDVTVEEALRHPTWKMGKKITIDCATLTNKGLEAIEAHHLFGVPLKDIHVVVHPQSIVHSLVEFDDGAMLAQLSHPDMRIPIQYALTYPDRYPTEVKALRLEEIRTLEFHEPDFRRFPCLELVLEAGRRGGSWPAVMNGANEAAVRAFLDGRLPFTGIARVIEGVMGSYAGHSSNGHGPSLEDILAADTWARARAEEVVSSGKRSLS
jgi:1-deoxy-D-xylulose-5-phosphate reductoisomerase